MPETNLPETNLSETPATDPRPFRPEAYAACAAALLGLRIAPEWVEAVSANLRVLAAAADHLEGFPLPDEAEAAPRFEA